ncbi:MAG: hypothetical protein ACKVQW_10610, partial [Pyrinomonadaceae bacterium]
MTPSQIRTLFLSSVFVVFGYGGAVAQDDPQKPLQTDDKTTGRIVSPLDTSVNSDPKTIDSPSNLNRVGVQQAQPLPMTLNDAIRRALENNNDIEVSRDAVRFQDTQVRGLEGVFDTVFTVSPTFTRNSTTGSSATKDFRVNAGMSKFFRTGGGSIQPFFNNTRTENQFAQAQVTSGTVRSGT